jgi:catechol 2,3-dioxygenase-like lactoylglutathione lyase family enzyme
MPNAAMNQRVFPQLRMTDWKRTRAFYVDGLGFSVDWEHRFEPGFPVFAQLTRDGLSLFLTEHRGDCQVGGAAYLVVDDVDQLFHEIRGRGIKPAEPPSDTEWHAREMTVVDPDGNKLRFSTRAAEIRTGPKHGA